MSATFAHLNLHSEYSMVDSTIRIKSLINAVQQAGMPAVAVTDQCNLFSLVKFFRAAEQNGIKPIAGADIWVDSQEQKAGPDRMVLLCQNKTGYLNLSRLISKAYLNRQLKSMPIVLPEWLEELNEGLIALSGAREGELGRWISGGRIGIAQSRLTHWMSIFDNRFYVELQRTGRDGERRYESAALNLAWEAGCPVVATNDVRFLKRDDFDAHEARVCIHDGRVLDDPGRPKRYSDQQYLRNPQEMQDAFEDLPGALENAIEIAQRCNLALETGKYYLPAFPIPEDQTEDSYLASQSQKGLEDRIATLGIADHCSREDYDKRLAHELDVIIQMGFPGYFLIVADFIQWSKDNQIPVGPGRGSGAGSLVAYALGITDLDPLQYDLLFERFLNPERVSMPDFDVDFCMDRRDEVIEYVARRYGRDKVCQIITYGSMAAKAVVRDTGRILGHPYGFVDSIAKLIPLTLGIKLKDALEEQQELKQRCDQEEDVGELMELALALEGLTRNAGKHAGGVVIAPSALTDFSPLYAESSGEGVVTQFDKDDVETVGLVKFDFLGLRTLTIIDWAVTAINQKRRQQNEPDLDMAKIPMDDEATFKLLKACNTTAVFQLESRGMKDLIRRLQPGNFDDIVALVALFRPGPLDSGMVDTYVDCKHGRQSVSYPHEQLEPILKTTYGVILYQEQVMQIAQVLAGYTLGGADILRRAMGKKKPAEMAKQRTIFVDGSVERGIDADLAESIFDLMEKFAGYGFNKSHSAAYALLSYQTAYLKTHYPAEFMAAVLSSDMDSTDKVVNLIDDARAMELEILPPSINHSYYQFKATDEKTVVYGLGAVKGVGQAAIDAMSDERDQNGPYEDLASFCQRVDLQKINKRVLEAMIYSGAMDVISPTRAGLMHQLPAALKAAEQESRNQAAGQFDMFGQAAPPPPPTGQTEEVEEWPERERLEGERNTLGLYLTGHPINADMPQLSRIISARLGDLGDIYRPPPPSAGNRRPRGQDCIVAGLVLSMRKRSERAAFVLLDDQTGRLETAVYGDLLYESAELLRPDQIVVVEGGLALDDFSGGFQVRAQRILSVDQAVEEYSRGIRLECTPDCNLQQLKQILDQYRPGHSPIWIHYAGTAAAATLKLGEDWQVNASTALVSQLSDINGVEQAKLLFTKDL